MSTADQGDNGDPVRMVIPADVQLTILGGVDDKMHLKFAHSTKTELRSQLQGSMDANPRVGNFFCFDYLGDDSLKADLLSYRKNYWVETNQKQQSDVIIDISRRGDSGDNSFYSKKIMANNSQPDVNPSLHSTSQKFLPTNQPIFRGRNGSQEEIRFSEPMQIQLSSQGTTQRNEGISNAGARVLGATVSSIMGRESANNLMGSTDNMNFFQRSPGAVVSVSSIEKSNRPQEIVIKSQNQQPQVAPNSPQFPEPVNKQVHQQQQRTVGDENADSILIAGSSLASVPLTSREQYFSNRAGAPRDIQTTRNPEPTPTFSRDAPGSRSAHQLPGPTKPQTQPSLQAQQNQLFRMASFGADMQARVAENLPGQRLDYAVSSRAGTDREPQQANPSKKPFFREMPSAAKLKQPAALAEVPPEVKIKVRESRNKLSNPPPKSNKWTGRSALLLQKEYEKSGSPAAKVPKQGKAGQSSEKTVRKPTSTSKNNTTAKKPPNQRSQQVEKLSKHLNDEPNPFLVSAYEAIESLKNQLLKQRHEYLPGTQSSGLEFSRGGESLGQMTRNANNEVLVKNLEVLEVELNKIQQQRDSFTPQDELYLSQVYERLSEVKSRLSFDATHRKDISNGSVVFRGLGQSEAYPVDSRKASVGINGKTDFPQQRDPFEQQPKERVQTKPNSHIRVTDEIEARLNEPIEQHMVIKTEGNTPRLITLQDEAANIIRKKKKSTRPKSREKESRAQLIVPAQPDSLPRPNRGDFYTKMMIKEASKKNRLETMRHKKSKAEMKQCTFQPKLSSVNRRKGIPW